MHVQDLMPAPASSSIGSLLKKLLRNRDEHAYSEILASYLKPGRDLEPYLRWDEKRYTRTCINRNDRFELLVICYMPGQSTSIHDYDSAKAWVLPLFGDLALERFSLKGGSDIKHTETQVLLPGAVVPMEGENSIHRFYNPGPERSASLNLYVKPMSRWRVYDEASGISSYSPAGPPH